MKLKLLHTIAILSTLVLGTYTSGHAQDSVKHHVTSSTLRPTGAVTPAKTKLPGYKPVVKTYPQQQTPASPNNSAAQPAGQSARPNVPAYQTPAPAVMDKSLHGQYEYIVTKTYGYQHGMIAAFYKSAMDTINVDRKKLKATQAQLRAMQDSLKALHGEVSSQEQTLNASNAKVNSIDFLGAPISKSTYNSIMWGLVIAFGAITAVVLFQSTSARREAKYRIKLYEDLDEEYKTYKTKSNEKEKKLARELQTVKNKLEEITGNPEY